MGAYTSNHIQSYNFKAPASNYYNDSAYIYTDLASTVNPNSTDTLEPQHQILLIIHLTPLEPQHQILLTSNSSYTFIVTASNYIPNSCNNIRTLSKNTTSKSILHP